MKKSLLLFAILSLIFIGCRSSETDSELDNSALVGTWNWVSTDGGIANNIHDTPASTGKTVKLTFTADSKYTLETNGTVTNSGTFSLYKNISSTDHVERVFIDFSNTSHQMIRSNDGTHLYLDQDAADGVVTHYQK